MTTLSCSLLARVQAHDPDRLALSVLETGARFTFGDLVTAASCFRRSLSRLGLRPGDSVGCTLSAGRDLSALFLACWEQGVRLELLSSTRLDRQDGFSLVIGATPLPHAHGTPHMDISELFESTNTWALSDTAGNPVHAALTAPLRGVERTINAAGLTRSIANFRATGPAGPCRSLLSLSLPDTLEGAFISIVLPLSLGIHVTIASESSIGDIRLGAALATAEWCEMSGPAWLALARSRSLPATVPVAICGSGDLHPIDRAEAQDRLGRPIRCGFGTVETGLWATSTEGDAASVTTSVRPLRSPLRLVGAEAAVGGEVLLRDRETDLEYRTGAVGWTAPSGRIEIAGSLSDVVVRAGRALLLSDTDRLLSRHPDIGQSRSFREHGTSPTEMAVSVCLTAADPPAIEAWLGAFGADAFVPERIVAFKPGQCPHLPSTEVLRAVVSGQAGRAVTGALTSRRFRRNPAYDEPGLVAAIERAVLGGRPLDFLMFWGCGSRRLAAPPDRAAIDALADLLAAAGSAAPLRARAHIVCTDAHATNNGHAAVHYATYFAEIAALAAGLDVSFELESAVWRRGGLTKSRIAALEQEPDFADRWHRFPLQDRFVQQASRHSAMADTVAAARHYYATCLLERELLASLFAGSVFLTYNGPEFNACFPDLPTLYIYPGPRGRTVKPWFVDIADQDLAGKAEVAAA